MIDINGNLSGNMRELLPNIPTDPGSDDEGEEEEDGQDYYGHHQPGESDHSLDSFMRSEQRVVVLQLQSSCGNYILTLMSS